MSEQEAKNRVQTAMQVLDNLPGLVFRIINDGDWTFAYANQGASELLGYTPGELIDIKKFRMMIPAEDQSMNRKIMANISPESPHYTMVYKLRSATGEMKWVREEATVFFTDNGEMVHVDGFLMDITDQKEREEALLVENSALRSKIKKIHWLDKLIGKSIAMQELFDLIIKAASSQATVVITGESGTGKELTARAIHNLGNRREKPFVVVNCGAIAENLIESEFFGYKKGAFTGAVSNRKGFFDAADGGTLFLDEIGEISLELQIKLLRVLDGDGYTPVGDTVVKHSNFRLVAATNRDLEDLVRSGQMREDFYYRINAIRLRTPPLRERKEDVILLAEYFLDKYAEDEKQVNLSQENKKILQLHSWPGNVRELQNVIHRFLIHGTINVSESIVKQRTEPVPHPEDDIIHPPGALSRPMNSPPITVSDMDQMEKMMIYKSLEKNRWHIGNTALDLGLSRRTMYRRMKKFNLKK